MSSPLEKFNKKHSSRWEVLNDFPEWEKENILNWVYAALNPADSFGRHPYDQSILDSIQSTERIMFHRDLGIPITDWNSLHTILAALLKSTNPEHQEKVVLFLELVIKYIRDSSAYHRFGDNTNVHTSHSILASLERHLQNGSKWSIVDVKNAESGLIERVSPELLGTAKESHNDDLYQAWGYAFGTNPKPELAISHAQSAIEYIASKSGLTNTTSKVYGSLIGDVMTHKGSMYVSAAKTEFDKTLSLGKQTGPAIDDMFAQWFANGLDLVQKSNPVRHKSKETEAFTVSIDAARQSVLMATVLYEFIDKKYITRKSKK